MNVPLGAVPVVMLFVMYDIAELPPDTPVVLAVTAVRVKRTVGDRPTGVDAIVGVVEGGARVDHHLAFSGIRECNKTIRAVIAALAIPNGDVHREPVVTFPFPMIPSPALFRALVISSCERLRCRSAWPGFPRPHCPQQWYRRHRPDVLRCCRSHVYPGGGEAADFTVHDRDFSGGVDLNSARTGIGSLDIEPFEVDNIRRCRADD